MLEKLRCKLKDNSGAMEFAFNKMLEFFCYAIALVFFCTFLALFVLQYQLTTLTDNICKCVSSEGGVNDRSCDKIANAVDNAGGSNVTIDKVGYDYVVRINSGHMGGASFTISADWCADGRSVQLEDPIVVEADYNPLLNGALVNFHFRFRHTSTLASAKFYKG